MSMHLLWVRDGVCPPYATYPRITNQRKEIMSKNVTIDGVEYAPVTTPSEVVMVRSANAGVFYGNLVSRDGGEVTLTNARRVYYWSGAATLSELATNGTSKPKDCKFPTPTAGEHLILGVCEVIPVTAKALESLDKVPEWSMG